MSSAETWEGEEVEEVGVEVEATVGEEAGEAGEGRRATGITSGGRKTSREFSCWSCCAVRP